MSFISDSKERDTVKQLWYLRTFFLMAVLVFATSWPLAWPAYASNPSEKETTIEYLSMPSPALLMIQEKKDPNGKDLKKKTWVDPNDRPSQLPPTAAENPAKVQNKSDKDGSAKNPAKGELPPVPPPPGSEPSPENSAKDKTKNNGGGCLTGLLIVGLIVAGVVSVVI